MTNSRVRGKDIEAKSRVVGQGVSGHSAHKTAIPSPEKSVDQPISSEEFLKKEELGFEEIKDTLKKLSNLSKNFGLRLTDIMSGDSPLHTTNAHRLQSFPLDRSPFLKKKPFLDVHFYVDSGYNYKANSENPNRVKLYCSFNKLGAGEKGQEFVAAIANECVKKGISLSMKSFDHNYDSCLFYTFQPDEFLKIVKKIYPSFIDIFQDVPRIFQGSLGDEIPVNHIGWVQEPPTRAVKTSLGSHSQRMGALGNLLASIDLDQLTSEQWCSFCKQVGVNPWRPWTLHLS